MHSLLQRLTRLEVMAAAIRARNWRVMWPNGEDAPPTPARVLAFEVAHGRAPASALRVLATLEGDVMAGASVDASARRMGAAGEHKKTA